MAKELKRAHDEAEKLRVEYLIAEKVSEADSDDENMLLCRRTGHSEEGILLKSFPSRITSSIEMKYTSVLATDSASSAAT